MRFALICIDRPDAAGLRTTTRPAHLDYLRSRAASLVQAGPLLNDAGNPIGSLLVVELADRAAAEAFAAGDPYAAAGLFEGVTVHGFRSVFQDGAEAGAAQAKPAG